MSGAEEMHHETWHALHTRWNKAIESAGNNDLDYFLKSCKTQDLKSITSMRSNVAMWNGYHETDAIIDDVESAINTLMSTGEGILNRLREEAEEEFK